MADSDNDKLKAIGLFKAGFNAKQIARELGIAYPKVCKWKPEAEQIETKEDLATVLNTDQVILHEIAEGVKDKLEDLVEDGGELVTGVLEKVDKLHVMQLAYKNQV